MKLSHAITYKLLKTISALLRVSPQWIKTILSNTIYIVLFYITAIRKNLVLQNIAKAFPKQSKEWHISTAKRSYKFFINQMLQFFTLRHSFHKSTISIKGKKILDDAIKQGKGVILVSGHFGAWEILGTWLGINDYPITSVAMKQKNRGSDKFFLEQRTQFGMKHLYRKSSLKNMYTVLEQNEILILGSDQDAKKHGMFVDFFGRKTSTPKGAAQFHIKSGAPIIFAICYQNKPNDYIIEFRKIETNSNDTIELITQSYTTVLEEYVRRFPEQYFWFHRRWKTMPPQELISKRINIDQQKIVEHAIDILERGGVIVYPTDTLYGFGADATNAPAIERINKIKSRGGPMSVLAADKKMAQSWMNITNSQKKLVEPYLGGAQTIIVPVKKGIVSDNILGYDNILGIRIPENNFCNELSKKFGKPIISTSVNRSGKESLNNIDIIESEFGSEVDLIIDAGTLPKSTGSTIYQLKDNNIIILRK